ncbi:putative multicopper oxidase [Daldinia caldariorum]|uniref:putative multicopper oxidase n=1 Tax=Daldinia caldariorum TaxID=326644 RepID=UPI002007DB3E|nr:putative multicopper oxidase [Daldinia caldariorum]KAI1469090.1 putative multicopper oxidase [Daldinia caldariorum]
MRRPLSLLPSLLLQVGLLHTGAVATTASIHDESWQPEYVLRATFENITMNCEERESVLFNGTTPGPALYLKEGETTWVRVYNDMSDLNITVHWHGLTMRTAPFSDGTPIVAQWPIAPGRFFDYEIHPEVGDAGTYFYHSHMGFQAVTAHGLLIVEDQDEPPYEYDDDIPVVFADWYMKSDEEVETGLTSKPFKWSGEPDALVFNDRTGNKSFEDAPDDSCKPYIIDVEPSTTYRFRFVGGTAISFVHFGIEDHSNLTVISADGLYTRPACTDRIQIGSGQRFDVLLTTKSEEELDDDGKDGQYWFRFESRGRPEDMGGYALLQYNTDSSNSKRDSVNGKRSPNARDGQHKSNLPKFPDKPPVKLPPDGKSIPNWLEYTLSPLNTTYKFPTLDEVTRTLYVTVNQDIINGSYNGGTIDGSLVWESNNLSWTEVEAQKLHYTPYLIQAYVEGKTPDYQAALDNKGWDPSTRAFPALVGEVLDIVWQSNSGPTGGFEYHPMHAHGEHYWDLGSGNGTYDAVANEEKFKNYTPMKRDTTMLHRYASEAADNTTSGWRAWRIRVTEDNVGAWMMHCHILQHMIMGMQTVWVFGDAVSILREIPPPYISGYLDYGGNAYGSETDDPLVLEYYTE